MRRWTVSDVMTRDVVSVPATASYRELVDLLVHHRFSAVPVVDEAGRVTGVVSETDLFRKIEYAGDEQPRLFEGHRRRGARAKAGATCAADLMSRPPVVVPAGTSIAAAARLLAGERIKRLPVTGEQGRLVGIVTRGDLLKVHLRGDAEILAEVRTDVLRPYAVEAAHRLHTEVTRGEVTLSGRVDSWSTADILVRLTRLVPGVVAVHDDLSYQLDDRSIDAPSSLYGVP
ncbi:CBS domain-containing protein [Actinoplanes sp. N902-109]|uniref:CBS domain-containing protein n=1 Tax=Actinoplanes sp. (strain N902-109) TaxID=649831 RepID=UPI00032940FC|nr:CBS domain-containing protein [Actinoplanes sp. N902-109]AGL16935.1 CBS domain-containing protein [Actinoplanes sp. N902-109]